VSRLQVTDLDRTFAGRPPVRALAGVTVAVESGQLLAVLGPSGCGKTTLLRAVAGMDRPDAGLVQLGDRVLTGPGVHVAPEHRAVGLVPQEGALFPHLDVARNIAFGLHRLPRAQRTERVARLLDLVDLAGMGRRRPHQLSGGQQQRVALARALAPQPDLVLLDEPFSALDTGLRASLRAEVAATLRAAGTTSVLVTHDQVEAMTMADTLAVMRAGEIVQVGPPHELYRRPVDAWTAGFLGDAVLLPGRRVDDGHVETVLGRLPLATDARPATDAEPLVFLRPEQVLPRPDQTEPSHRPDGAERTGADALVVQVTFLGPDATVDLDVAGTRVAARWPSSLLPAVGDRIRVAVAGPVLAYPPEPAGPVVGSGAGSSSGWAPDDDETADAATAATSSSGDIAST
jgi:iron(III) transport system ATP-binding protein